MTFHAPDCEVGDLLRSCRPCYDAFGNHPAFRFIPMHHEQTASMAAEGTSANEIIVALESHGIAADKLKEEGGQTVTWAITVPKGERGRATNVLVANHLPPPRPTGIKELFPGGGMIPTQTEEGMRKFLSQEPQTSFATPQNTVTTPGPSPARSGEMVAYGAPVFNSA